MKKFPFLILLIVSYSCFASSSINLLFHIGLGANGHYEIGGTVENSTSDKSLYSAITYVTIDDKCNPSEAKVANTGAIEPQSVLEFRIPIEGTLSSYRILSITGWNNMGIPVEAEDKTTGIIKKREKEAISKCNSSRLN